MEVAHCQLQDVGFLELGDVLAFGLEGGHHEVFELVEAAVDARAPLSLQHGLHHLAVLVRARDGLLVGVRVRRRVEGPVRREHGASGKDHCCSRGDL